MQHAAGKVVALFENTWMRACGVGALEKDGSRKINKMGNIELLLDVDDERKAFDWAVIKTIRQAIPDFSEESLKSFYDELKQITGEDDSMVRRGLSSSLGKIAPDDLLLSGALSRHSPFFNHTTVGREIRKRGMEEYGNIEIREELDLTDKPVAVDYPEVSDPDFELLNDEHLPNYVPPGAPSRPLKPGTHPKDSLSNDELRAILATYQSKSFMGFLGRLWLFSCFISPYRSQTMIQLSLLLERQTISRETICAAIRNDDDGLRRLSLFNHKEDSQSNGTGTDEVIVRLKAQLR
ncbi:hypothetical protein Lrub_1455 [Legionella rubrilucens]|uniref:Uncharacterized protein n=2 Tax=Legionella rubrilucens TaxID=458 RepID=A0A0W0XXF5_9GAMM|nr:hypothetical protein Lrub_1455 [Legionella rubrilucens]